MANDFAPKQDWQKYEAATASMEIERALRLTPNEKFAKYAALFNVVFSARLAHDRENELETERWLEKLQRREACMRTISTALVGGMAANAVYFEPLVSSN